jgi:DNA polymerase I-like protein with 3'-5' exonuclease and polymerase domains
MEQRYMDSRVVISFDAETHLFKPGEMAPPIVCVSEASAELGVSLHDRVSGLPRLAEALELAAKGEVLVVGQNIGYDLACALSHDGREIQEIAPAIWGAYDALGIHCTRVREILIDIARGSRFAVQDGRGYRKTYSLDEMARARLGIELDKETWRLNYADLADVPIDLWPEGARQYAMSDAAATIAVWGDQEQQVARDFPQYEMWSPECGRQSAFAFALQLMKCRGIMVDQPRVRELRAKLGADMALGLEQLRAAGLIDPKKGSKKMAAIRALIEETWAGEGEVPRTPKGAIQTAADVIEQCTHPALQGLVDYAHAEKILSTFVDKLEAAGDKPLHADTDVLGGDTGRTSCRNPNLQQQPREPGVRECFRARDGMVLIACDFDNQEVRTFAQVLTAMVGRSRLAERFRADPGYDAHTDFAAQLLQIDYAEALRRKKAKEPEFLSWRQRAKACFHPDTEILTRSRGWARIADLTYEDEVAAAYPGRDGECVIAWERPLALTRREAPEGRLVRLKNKGIDLRVTPDHRMLGFRQDGEPYVTTPEELPKARCWASAGIMSSGRFPGGQQDWALLRLAVATQADGSYTTAGIRFGFSKKRKVERMRALLEPLSGWTETRRGRVTFFYLRKALAVRVRRLLTPDKTMPGWWIGLPLKCREEILDEATHWDSHVLPQGRRYAFATTKRENADVLQAIAALSGRKSRLTREKKSNPKHAALWRLSIGDHSATRGEALEPESLSYGGEVVCLSVPSSFVLVRDGGIPVVAGQCIFGFPGGMGATKFRLYARGYGLSLSQQEAEDLKARYFEFEPYARDYFSIIANLCERGGGEATMTQLYSGRIRGRCHFPAAANGQFQGLAADASKSALWEVAKRCYGAPGTEGSALLGCRPVVFVHDEIIVEAPEDYAHEAAVELDRVMCDAMQELTPDVPARASPALMRNWSKSASAAFGDAEHGDEGRYITWEEHLAREAKRKGRAA